jgi:cysteine-rich repeat protein
MRRADRASSMALATALLALLRPAALPAAEGVAGIADVVARTGVTAMNGVRHAPAARAAVIVERPLPTPAMPTPWIPFRPRALAAPRVPIGPSPAASLSMPGLADLSSFPPDTQGAVGPAHLVVMLNGGYLVQDRRGRTLRSASLLDFWAGLGVQDAFDPQVTYDPGIGRWIATAAAERRTPASSLLVAVSTSSNPIQPWHVYRVDGDPTDAAWLDQPWVGFTADAVVVQANMFTNADDPAGTQVLTFDKAALAAGAQADFLRFRVGDIGNGQHPAVTYDPGVTDVYLVQSWNADTGMIRLYRISGPAGGKLLSPVAFVAAPSTWAADGGTIGSQLGSPTPIDSGDARMQKVVYRNGTIWSVQGVFLPPSAPSRGAVQWWQLAPDGTLLQRGLLDDAAGGHTYAFPTLAVNRFDDVLIGYSRFSASEFASAAYAFRFAGDPAGSLRDDTLLKAGEASYVKTDRSGANRWGDYSAAVVDPANDGDLWTLQEYARPDNQWGTWWGRISPRCGNGVLDPGEQCDDGNTVDGDGCDSTCVPTACGNGVPSAGEECDDGNTVDGDGCSAGCEIECASDADCDDGDACTEDVCTAARCTSRACGQAAASCAVGGTRAMLVDGPACAPFPQKSRRALDKRLQKAGKRIDRAKSLAGRRGRRLVRRVDRDLRGVQKLARRLARRRRIEPACRDDVSAQIGALRAQVRDMILHTGVCMP